jgi:hypothetical protein
VLLVGCVYGWPESAGTRPKLPDFDVEEETVVFEIPAGTELRERTSKLNVYYSNYETEIPVAFESKGKARLEVLRRLPPPRNYAFTWLVRLL